MTEHELPESLRPLFPEYDFRSLNWQEDRELIVSRILSAGTWDAVSWLRRRIGDEEIRNWIVRNRGRGLDARRLRFWQLILGLPRRTVDGWMTQTAHQIWANRVRK